MNVTARAIRSGKWWAVEVPEIQGLHTQAKRLDQVPEMVRDAAGLMGHLDVAVTVEPVLPQQVSAVVKHAKASRASLQQAKVDSQQASREATRSLQESGLSVRDIAALIDITPQRVSQLSRELATV